MPIVNPPTQYAGSTSAAILLSDGSTRIYYQAADGAIHEHQENNTSIEMLELASLAFLADSTSLVHELALTWHIRFAREITR